MMLAWRIQAAAPHSRVPSGAESFRNVSTRKREIARRRASQLNEDNVAR
jgi:hypothetical protein